MKKIYSTLFFVVMTVIAYSQQYTANFDDGTKVDYDVISDKFTDCKPFNIRWGGIEYGLDESHGYQLGASYFMKDKFYSQIHFNLLNGFGLLAEGVYFLKSWNKEKTLNFPVKEEYAGYNTIKKYLVKHTLQRQYYLGPHIGYAYNNIVKDGYKYSGDISLGAALYRGKFIKVTIQDAVRTKPTKMRGTTQFGLYTDFVYYMITTDSTSSNTSINTTKHSNIGFRMFISGKGSLWGKRDFGLFYLLGAGTGGTESLYPMLGFGIYGGF
jgi:hypothetical protein